MIAAMITHDVFHSNNNNEELEKIVEDSKLFFSPDNDNDDDALDKITAKDLKQHLHNEALHDDGYLNHAVMVDGVREVLIELSLSSARPFYSKYHKNAAL